MTRRKLMLLLGGAMTAWRTVRAQQPKIPRVGILSPAENEATLIFEAFRQGLRELGYVEGHNIILEYRFAHGDFSALPRLAEELVHLPVDVIVADTSASTRAAPCAAPSIPIVMGAGIDPVALGLAHSLARPGGNVTGFTLMSHELSAKRVDLMRTVVPDATAMMVLLNPSNSLSAEANLRDTEEATGSLGLALTRVEAATPEALHALGPEALGRGGGPVLVLPDAMFWNHRREIIALAATARLPALYPEREYADDGGLMTYGPSVPDNFRQAAGYVDRILRGAKPGDLPIQEPAKFDFVVNLKTAKALGLTVPPSILARADEVIE
jgi:putative tryptophan/tyrosine transport system substrate-binding protein